jgi:hypothetical protein
MPFFVAGCGEAVAPTSLKLLDEFSGGLAWLAVIVLLAVVVIA